MPILSIVLFVFGCALLIYALITYLSKKITVFITMSASVKDKPKRYAEKFAQLIAFLAIAPISGAVVGLFLDIVIIPIIVFVVLFIGLLIVGIKIFMKEFY